MTVIDFPSDGVRVKRLISAAERLGYRVEDLGAPSGGARPFMRFEVRSERGGGTSYLQDVGILAQWVKIVSERGEE